MNLSGDELAGVVDRFGGLTPTELGTALAELAFKQGEPYDPGAFDDDISAAVEGYHLIALERDAGTGERLLVPGPAAFPTLPEGAVDLVHILDVTERTIERDEAARAATDRFRADAARAVEAGDPDRVERLLDVSYEIEAWAAVDLADERAHLDRIR